MVRGCTPDGARLVYRSQGLSGFGNDWRLLSVPPDGGGVREEAGIYRAAVADSVAQIRYDPGGRTLTTWKPAQPGLAGCRGSLLMPDVPAGPVAYILTVLRLGQFDGRPLSAIPSRSVQTPSALRPGTSDQTIRLLPTELEIRQFAVDPYGPAVAPDGSGMGYLSDGETVWRVDLEDASAPAESVGVGAFPSLSPGGDLLAVAQPVGLDSVIDTTIVPSELLPCLQETVTIFPSSWQTVLYDLTSPGIATVLAPGLEPRFDPMGQRMVVRRPDGLYWVDLSSGAATFIPGSLGGFSPALSPDGAWLAFSKKTTGDRHDVFLMPLQAPGN